jgi:hypothetical protein
MFGTTFLRSKFGGPTSGLLGLILGCVVLVGSAAFGMEPTVSLYNKNQAMPTVQFPKLDFGPKASRYRYDKRMIRAMEIAQSRARRHSTARCWRYVKDALLSADVLASRPTTAYAKSAADELTEKYGFKRLKISDPYKAPLGSVLVYGGRGAGHVEFRTKTGFVSDFVSTTPSKRPLIGVFIKPS